VTGPEPQHALARLDALTRRLRAECPWDREQDERSIVPHTVEEAYELADAAHKGDDAKLRDELGDVLFQVHFLALLMEERGVGGLAEVAEHCRQKLIRRHPHVFGAVAVDGAADVLRNWDAIKREEPGRAPGVFADVPENLPGPLYARKVQRRAASAGVPTPPAELRAAVKRVERGERAQADGPAERDERFDAVGDLLFACVDLARRLKVDPELALRASADRFRDDVAAGSPAATHPPHERNRS